MSVVGAERVGQRREQSCKTETPCSVGSDRVSAVGIVSRIDPIQLVLADCTLCGASLHTYTHELGNTTF